MASFSPTFSIDITDDIASGETTTVTNPGQAFEIIGVLISGVNGGTATVRKNDGGGGTAAVATLIAAGSSCQITDANASFAATDNIHVTGGVQTVTRVTILCRSATPNNNWTNTTPAA